VSFSLFEQKRVLVAKDAKNLFLALSVGVLVLQFFHSSNDLSRNVSALVSGAGPLSRERGHRGVELRVELAHVVLGEDLDVVLIFDDFAAASSVVVDRRGDQVHIFLEFRVIFYVLIVVRQVEAFARKSLRIFCNTILIIPDYFDKYK
jgi:hypothetical protein